MLYMYFYVFRVFFVLLYTVDFFIWILLFQFSIFLLGFWSRASITLKTKANVILMCVHCSMHTMALHGLAAVSGIEAWRYPASASWFVGFSSPRTWTVCISQERLRRQIYRFGFGTLAMETESYRRITIY